MRRLIAPALAVGLLTTPAMAQETAKPGPEHARMGYFAGTWQFEGESKPSPMGPGGKMTGTSTCEWFAGGFHLVCRGDMTGPRGAGKDGAVWALDPSRSVYTYFGYSSMGDAFYVTGSVTGKVWTWNADLPVEGATMKMRATLTEEAPAAYAFKLEFSADGTTWMVVEEGRATKKSK
jgi:hypothetical protein